MSNEEQTNSQQPNAASSDTGGSSPSSGLAIASLVLGIIGLLTSLIVVGAVFGLIGLILGIVALSKKQSKGMSITGIIISLISILIVAGIMFFAANFFSFLDDFAEEAGVDIDTDGNGISIESEDGEESFSISSELPDDFPAEVPIYEPAELNSSTSYLEGGEMVYIVSLFTDDDLADVDEFYGQAFADGWTEQEQSGFQEDVLSTYFASRDNLEVVASVSVEGDGTNINLTVNEQRQ